MTVTDEDYIHYWTHMTDKISSSKSALHFGHYRAATAFPQLTRFHAIKIQLAFQKGIYFPRWAKGLSVLLEKIAGVILVNKLRSILLMEADFNMLNKLVFGVRMMKNARDSPKAICRNRSNSARRKYLRNTILGPVARSSKNSSNSISGCGKLL